MSFPPFPDRRVLVVGTGTEIGKTWVGAAALTNLREAGATVSARKPAQSFEPGEGPTDAEVLASATGEAPHDVCPAHRWYEVPMAPPMAAEVLGRPPFTMSDLLDEITFSDGINVGLIEGVGGPYSPVASDGDCVTLAHGLDPDLVVLVADAELGTINAVRLSRWPFASTWPVVVFLNRYQAGNDLHRRNFNWLRGNDGFDVVTDIAELAGRIKASDA